MGTGTIQKRSIYNIYDQGQGGGAAAGGGETDHGEDVEVHSERKRRLTSDQVHSLERNFEMENKLDPERKMQLARELSLQPRQVAVWFQNRRARWKTKQLERDYDTLKCKVEALQAENETLRNEVRRLSGHIRVKTEFVEGNRDGSPLSVATTAGSDLGEVVVPKIAAVGANDVSGFTTGCNSSSGGGRDRDYEPSGPVCLVRGTLTGGGGAGEGCGVGGLGVVNPLVVRCNSCNSIKMEKDTSSASSHGSEVGSEVLDLDNSGLECSGTTSHDGRILLSHCNSADTLNSLMSMSEDDESPLSLSTTYEVESAPPVLPFFITEDADMPWWEWP